MQEKLTTNRVSALEFQKRLAIAFWQKGDYENAKRVAREVLEDEILPEDGISFYIILGMCEISAGKFDAALDVHREGRSLLDVCPDTVLCAKFRNGMAITLRNLKRYDEAFEEYTAVRVLMEEAGDAEGYAQAGNNIANLMIDAGNPAGAYEYLDAAQKVCADPGIRCQIFNTRARALLVEGKIEEARSAALTSLELTAGAEEERLYFEHLATYLEACGVNLDIDKLKHAVEAGEIRRALTEANGSVYRAAQVLNLTCEGLRWKLEHKHRDLLHLRTPPRKSPANK